MSLWYKNRVTFGSHATCCILVLYCFLQFLRSFTRKKNSENGNLAAQKNLNPLITKSEIFIIQTKKEFWLGLRIQSFSEFFSKCLFRKWSATNWTKYFIGHLFISLSREELLIVRRANAIIHSYFSKNARVYNKSTRRAHK
jgi:hypothetical protein